MKVAFHTLGCKVNQYETQAIREAFLQDGFSEVTDSDYADVYIINTCTVTHLADRKSRQYIRKAKKINPGSMVVVTGCYAQIEPGEVQAIPGVDFVCGTNEKGRILEYVRIKLEKPDKVLVSHHLSREELVDYEELGAVTSMESRTRAFVKIQEGCDRFCSYCIIPYARGPIRSRSPKGVMEEIQQLLGQDYREIILTGINTALYGRERDFQEKYGEEFPVTAGGSETRLLGLIKMMENLPGDFRIRLSSLEPNVVKWEELEELLSLRRLCHHFHFSLQSGSNRILKAMNRRYTREYYLSMVRQIQENYPHFGITTDVIVGFPGEEESDFMETLSIMDEVNFLKVHIFPYSLRKGTEAETMQNPIPSEIKKERMVALQLAAEKSQDRFFKQNVGNMVRVLIEENNEQGVYTGFSDEYIRVFLEEEVPLNQFVRVELTEPWGEGMKGRLISCL